MSETGQADVDAAVSYDDLFKQRYTSEDPDYVAAGFTPAPVIYPWFSESTRRYHSPPRPEFRRDVRKWRRRSPELVEPAKRRRSEEHPAFSEDDHSAARSSAH
uniref:Uncharacterized protein n=1 Tax=Trichuris muris TaxID=70415 RepID=A0A5S6QPL7_TRIMR